MTLKTLAPILTTDDMDRSVRFYVDVLGFTCGIQTSGYSSLYRDAVRIMLAAPNAHGEWRGPNFTGQLYIGRNDRRGGCVVGGCEGPCRGDLRGG